MPGFDVVVPAAGGTGTVVDVPGVARDHLGGGVLLVTGTVIVTVADRVGVLVGVLVAVEVGVVVSVKVGVVVEADSTE